MKTYFATLFTIIYFTIGLENGFAKIIRVNNQETANSPSENSYNSVQDAYNASEHGDTIYLEPTPVAHGNLEVGRRLVFIGGGYFHDQNQGLSAQPYASTITGNWFFKNGSSGSKIIGLSFAADHNGVTLEDNNIEISNCFFSGAPELGNSTSPINFAAGLENITVSGCYFTLKTHSIYGRTFRGGPVLNLVFINNISERRVNIPDNSSGVFSNNLVRSKDFVIGGNSNFQIHNNIFLGTNEVNIPAAIGNKFSHNIADQTFNGTANNNQEKVPVGEIFIVSQSLDGKYQIKENGAADGKGLNGADIGPFGGMKPYSLSGLPNIPIISQLATEGVSNPAGKLPIILKAKAN